MRKIKFLLLVIFSSSQLIYSQWEAGASYSKKTGIPESGFSLSFGRNLPFQWPLVGFMIKAEGSFYELNYDISEENTVFGIQSKQSDIHLNIIGTFYTRVIQPYAGLGIGISSFIYERRQSESLYFVRIKKNPFFIEGLTGFRVSLPGNFYPFGEIHFIKYLSSFSESIIKSEISSFQIQWNLGFRIKFDTI